MQLTIEIDEGRLAELLKERVASLFRTDGGYRDDDATERAQVRKLLNEAITPVLIAARDKIAGELPAIAEASLRAAAKYEIDLAAKRGLGVMRKLFAGFDPAKLTPEQAEWLKAQMTGAGTKPEGEKEV